MPSGKKKIGKIDQELFTRFLLNRLGKSDPTVIVPPKTGIDAGVIDIGDNKMLVVAEDPVFSVPGISNEMFGWFTMHVCACDVAVMGVKPRYATYSLLLPPGFPDDDLRAIVDTIHATAVELEIAIVGGHTGYYSGFASPVIGGITVFAIAEKDRFITPAGARPGNDVLLTKGPAIETAALLSILRETELKARYPEALIERAKALFRQVTVVTDALTAMEQGGVTAMHDATEGGVIGGLFEICEASGVGMVIDEQAFVYPDEVQMVCEAFSIDPVASIAEGSLLITADPAYSGAIMEALKAKGIASSVIGRVVEDVRTRVLHRRDGTTVSLAVPDQDPFWPVYYEGFGETLP